MSYIPFTEQQREQARRTDLAAFQRQCGEEVRMDGELGTSMEYLAIFDLSWPRESKEAHG